MNIIKVKKNEKDGKLILKWRNDPITRKCFFNQKFQYWDNFKKIFFDKYFLNYIPPLFAIYNNKKIAFIGLKNNENFKNSINISINLNPEYRGKKLAVPIILKILIYINNNYPEIKNIIAEIKEFNIPSIKSFEKCNFKLINKLFKNDSTILVYNFNMENLKFCINGKIIGKNYPTYFIAELSCNHNQDIKQAYKLIDEAHKSGANAIKLQTYTADTMTINSDKPYFKDCLKGSIWEGETLYNLYKRAYTPWEWTQELKEYANKLGMDLFSSPFDVTAVDFLEELEIPCYKIASFEIVDHVLIKRIAQTGKPVIISSGMASRGELEEAVNLLRKNGCNQIAMLKCTSAYPAKPEDANLITLQNMAQTFDVIPGLSDHTLGVEVPITAVALGAKIIEKHFTLSRESGSPDDAFSLTPDEFKQMVDSVRIVEKAIGKVTYGGTKSEEECKKFRKSLFIVKDVKRGDILTKENIRSIRPGYGLHTRYYEEILGKKVREDIERGEPLSWKMI